MSEPIKVKVEKFCVICDSILDYESLKRMPRDKIQKKLDFYKFCKKHNQELENIINMERPQAQESQKEVDNGEGLLEG
jgi:hypothetical protein